MRVTVDLDCLRRRVLKRALWRASRIGSVEVRLSPSHRGVHLILRNLPISYKESLALRGWIGDDSTRLKFDSILAKKPLQILWRWKQTDDGQVYESELIDVLPEGAPLKRIYSTIRQIEEASCL